MDAINIYLTGQERELVIDAIQSYIMMMAEGATPMYVEDELEKGLGSAMYKLHKGYKTADAYRMYKQKEG